MKRLLSIFLLIIFFAGCQDGSTPSDGRPLVVTSIPPYVSLIEAIVGETMKVESALGPNFDPHTAEATPSQMRIVQNANLFVGVGEGYEKKLIAAIREGAKEVRILELNQEIPLLPFSQDSHVIDACHGHQSHHSHHSHSKDLHFWLGPKSLILQVEILVDALIQLNPDQSDIYTRNGDVLIKKIKTLDKELGLMLRPFQGKAIIVSHNALGYFCHEYQMIQISVECEGKNPRPQDVESVLNIARNSDAICVFTAEQFNNKGAELIAEKLSLRVESFDPLREDVLETLEHLGNAIAR